MNSGRREERAGLSRVHHRPHSVKTNKSDPRVTSPLATKPESRAPPPPRLLRAALSSIPPYPSPALASLFSGRAYSAVDRGSAVTWVGGEERRTERERERERPSSSSSAVCSVLCLILGGRESELLVRRISSSESNPRVFSHPSPLPFSLTRVAFSPEPRELLRLLSLDFSQQFALFGFGFFFLDVLMSTRC